jgi:hypothetical protein
MFTAKLAHYFYPGFSNNHKAKLLHSTTLLLLAAFLVTFQVFLSTIPSAGLKVLGYAANISPEVVINLTNQKREEAGLSKLNYNAQLASAAKAKGEHMLANDYSAHVAPDGTEPWAFFLSSGYKYRYAGENLARDFSDPNSAVEAWMASPSHKENMLSSKYNEIGIAVVEGDLAGVDTTIIVQLFGTQLGDSVSSVPIAQAKPVSTVVPTAITLSPVPTNQPTLIPTPTLSAVAPIAQISPVQNLPENGAVGQKATGYQILFSPFDTTRSVSLVTIILLLIVMAVDAYVVAKKKIARVGGRVFAHLAFLGMILAIVLLAKAGEIL